MYTDAKVYEVIRELLEQASRDNNKAEYQELIANALIAYKNTNEMPDRKKMILIVGISNIRIDVLQAIAKEKGFEKERLEFVEYSEATNYPFKKLQYGTRFGLIIMGPAPHKTRDCDGFDSLYSMLKETEGYPPIVFCKSRKNKITKCSFADSLDEAMESGLIAA